MSDFVGGTKWKWLLVPAVFLLIMVGCGPAESEDPEVLARLPEEVDFNFHIKPLLSDRCFACHGPDANTREGGLRLDTKEGAFKTLLESGGKAIVKGNLNKSTVWQRIHSVDEDEVMPPPTSNLALTEYEKALIGRWIKQGAEWKQHWAYEAPRKPDVPTVKEARIENPIDAFVVKRLQQEGLEPSPEADKARLLRRVSLDLTGLPPTPEALDDFLADDSEDAYEKVVDQLLATPAYAERMALEWMDVSRYADSHGYHADGYRLMWPWRDWVISAFDENMPFDQFVTWQLAGDLMPGATRDQKLATAFHRNHPMTAEGGIVDEEYRLEYVFDRTNTTARAFMGLTLECSRCHDHKFDPFSQKEYYQLSAFFNQVKELGMTGDDGNYGPTLLLPDEAVEDSLNQIDRQILAIQQRMDLQAEEVAKTEAFISAKSKLQQPKAPKPVAHYALDNSRQKREAKGRKTWYTSDKAKATVSGTPEHVAGIKGQGLRFDGEYEMLYLHDVGYTNSHESFSVSMWIKPDVLGKPQTLVGNAGEKNNFWRGWDFYLDSTNQLTARLIHSLPHNYLHAQSIAAIPTQTWTHVALSYDGSMKAGGLQFYINGKAVETEVKFDHLYKDILPVTVGTHKPDTRPLRAGKSYRNYTGEYGIYEGALDEISLFDRELTEPEMAAVYAKYGGKDAPSPEPASKRLASRYLASQSNEYKADYQRLKELQASRLTLVDEIPEVMVMEDMPKPRATHVLDRGAYDVPTEVVEANVPSVLGGFPEDLPKNRLGLAKWITSSDNPLTARVTVNRYWQMYFGKGLVSTPEDFGSQGNLPTHPELLDWLATTFMESGWDIKALQKTIVMSTTYRQTSHVRPELETLDPENLLLARGPRYRLPAELIRDNALAASGLLSQKVGGPSVKPYQPKGLWIDKGSFSHILMTYEPDSGENLYRRSLYTFIRRTSPPPSMIIFDGSDRNFCLVKRQNTNTPLQALVLMNDPQYVEAARVLAARMQREGGPSVVEQLSYGFRLLTSRVPEEDELSLLAEMYQEEKARFDAEPEEAEALLSVGEAPLDEELDTTQTAALAMVASLMINHDEAYTKR